MSKSYIRGVVAALALAVGGVMAPMAWSQAQAPQPKISPTLAKTFKAAQEAQQAKRWPEVVAKAEEVLGTSGRKPDDTYYAYFLLFEAARATGNNAEMRKSLEGLVDSGFLTPAQQAPYLRALMSIASQAKDHDAAIDYANRVIKTGAAEPEIYTTVGQSYYQKGNFGEASKFLNNLVNDQIKDGKTPREQDLALLQSSYAKLGNKNAEIDALEKLVVYYPKTSYWDALLYTVRGNPALEPRQKLQVYRLMWATGTLKQGTDYARFAELATMVGLPAEAQKVFEAGLKANAFTDETEKARATRLMASAAKTAEADKAGLAKLEADGKAAATGDLDVVVGMSYYSFDDPAKAVEALQRGVSKGGLKEALAVEGPLVLGIAQVRAKDNAGALKTFQGIKATDPEWQRIVKLWTLYAK
jgi:tetratricopeptide (TPR) repeat protein